jgi:hypothetical protein
VQCFRSRLSPRSYLPPGDGFSCLCRISQNTYETNGFERARVPDFGRFNARRSAGPVNKKKTGGLSIYQFHGIGGPLFRVTAEAHQKLLQYLKDNQADYSVTTFSEAMDFETAKKGK